MHHYLDKKVPQAKIKFYVTDKENDRIIDEHLFTAEKKPHSLIESEDSPQKEKARLLNYDIDLLLAKVEQIQAQKNKEKEARIEQEMEDMIDESLDEHSQKA